MFSLLDKYIGRHVVVSSVAMLILLAVLRTLFAFLDELRDLDKGDYQLSDAFLYVSLMFPNSLLELFPMSVLIGTLFGLGTLAANSELTVMRSAGLTTWQIAGSAIKASLILMVFVTIIGEWVAPASTKAAQQLKTSAINYGELSVSKTGLWAKHENKIIQIGSLLAGEKLKELTVYELDENNHVVQMTKAESAQKQDDQWLLQSVVKTRFNDKSIEFKNTPLEIWQSPLEDNQIETLTLEPETMNLFALIRYITYLKANNMEPKNYILAAWRKVMQPLAIAVMVFVAVSFIFGPMRSVSMGARILSGVLLGFTFHLASQSFGPISLVFNVWPIVGAVFPLILFSLLGYSLMKRSG